jgi:signal peptidase II
MSGAQRLHAYTLLGLFFFIVDRFTKWYALTSFQEKYSATSWLSFDLVFNRGISFGLFHSDSSTLFSLVTLVIILITGILFWYTVWQGKIVLSTGQCEKGHSILGQMLVLSGALSNIIDRFFYGGVIDFIMLTVADYTPFGIFNVADVCIVVGVGLMFITGLKDL